MSENLKRLKGEVSEKAIKAATVRHLKSEIYKYKYLPPEKRAIEFTALSGMTNIEEIERKAEEARKEEQQVKEQLKETKEEYKKVIEEVISILSDLGKEEADSASKYQKLSNKNSTLPTVSRILSDFAMDELRHSNKFFDLTHELRREISK